MYKSEIIQVIDEILEICKAAELLYRKGIIDDTNLNHVMRRTICILESLKERLERGVIG